LPLFEHNWLGSLRFSSGCIFFNSNGLSVDDGYKDWSGPYLSDFGKDPWGRDYYIDPDYFCGAANPTSPPWGIGKYEEACNGMPVGSWVVALVSWGKDGMVDYYGGDNIAFSICKP